MKAIEFPEVNIRIAENQPEYETIPANVKYEDPSTPMTMCLELDEAERQQVAETGQIWLTVMTSRQPFHPIRTSLLKPDDLVKSSGPVEKIQE